MRYLLRIARLALAAIVLPFEVVVVLVELLVIMPVMYILRGEVPDSKEPLFIHILFGDLF